MGTGKVINKISNRLRRRSKKIQESIGISGAKGNILNYILVESENHPVYQKEIEEEFGLRPSTATETLKNLEQAELICGCRNQRMEDIRRLFLQNRRGRLNIFCERKLRNRKNFYYRELRKKKEKNF